MPVLAVFAHCKLQKWEVHSGYTSSKEQGIWKLMVSCVVPLMQVKVGSYNFMPLKTQGSWYCWFEVWGQACRGEGPGGGLQLACDRGARGVSCVWRRDQQPKPLFLLQSGQAEPQRGGPWLQLATCMRPCGAGELALEVCHVCVAARAAWPT
jgi:hypothetical protein